MKAESNERRERAAADRAALREELSAEPDSDLRVSVFDALAKQADEDGEEAPPMPESLRDRLVDKFATPPERVAAVAEKPAPAQQGVVGRLVEFFAHKQVAYGGIAVAACALVLFALLPRGGGDPGAGTGGDTLRGGGAQQAGSPVAVYLFPEELAAPVLELMNSHREVRLFENAADLDQYLAGVSVDALGVAADLRRRVVLSFRGGEPFADEPIEGGGAADVLLGIRAAVDASEGGAE